MEPQHSHEHSSQAWQWHRFRLPASSTPQGALWLYDGWGHPCNSAPLPLGTDGELALADLTQLLVRTDATFVVTARYRRGIARGPSPCMTDVREARLLWRLARTLGLSLQDHIVLRHNGACFSFRAAGLL